LHVLIPGQLLMTTHLDRKIEALLAPYQRFGVHLGLDRIQQLLAKLGNPHQQMPVIHVAGTNGKGSVCAYLSAILTAAGYRVGRYTSPHLVDWCERICLNEQEIAPLDLYQILAEVQSAAQQLSDSPTQFEVITAAAWYYFAQQQVEIAVVEVGLGGRLDATNVCDRPLVSVITSISREHWQVLGSTLAEIAGEKAGILKADCPAVIGTLPPDAAAVVQQRLTALNCPAVWVKPAVACSPPAGEPLFPQCPQWAMYQGIQYPLPLLGAVQLTNSAIAIAALHLLQQHSWHFSETAIQQGMANTRWLGRLQWVDWQGHKLLLDGAHNPAAARALRQFVDSIALDRPVQWVMGMLSTKEHDQIFQALLRKGDRLYLVPVPDHSTAHPESLTTLAREICPALGQCQAYDDLNTGLTAAFAARDRAERSQLSEPLTVLCGSLYLVGYFLNTHTP
jgi:dihydrofolate synthase/folylpolyglutamate synthase